MSRIRLRESTLRLDPKSYEKLRQRVLYRDGWRCQSCGAMSNLEIHHRKFRSHSGSDSEENLITLCAACHAAVHGQEHNSQ
jgi:5-methylcytosine-specific restriction endonuclease McrA